jgi:GNAT superfamily N-acetyltransferase
MSLPFARATEADAAEIAALRSAVARDLTALHGRGHWSFEVTDRSVAFGIRTSYVLAALDDGRIVGTLRLSTKKPWAIDRASFSDARRPLYLTDMAVAPGRQRQGIGRRLIEEATTIARDWPADAIRLDAYDAPAGAGLFYAKCGFTEAGRRTYRGVPLIYFELRV